MMPLTVGFLFKSRDCQNLGAMGMQQYQPQRKVYCHTLQRNSAKCAFFEFMQVEELPKSPSRYIRSQPSSDTQGRCLVYFVYILKQYAQVYIIWGSLYFEAFFVSEFFWCSLAPCLCQESHRGAAQFFDMSCLPAMHGSWATPARLAGGSRGGTGLRGRSLLS